MRVAMIAAVCAALISSTVSGEARSRRHKPESDVSLLRKLIAQNEKMDRELVAIRKLLRPDAVASTELDAVPLPRNRALPKPMIPDVSKSIKGYSDHIAKSAKLRDLTPRLADKVAEILAACPGARMSSGHRPGARVRGSGRPSLHSHYPSKAADLAGNPSCIRKYAAGWPGGFSTDYAAVNHYHLSYAPHSREWGARFVHYGSKYARARRHHVAVTASLDSVRLHGVQ